MPILVLAATMTIMTTRIAMLPLLVAMTMVKSMMLLLL